MLHALHMPTLLTGDNARRIFSGVLFTPDGDLLDVSSDEVWCLKKHKNASSLKTLSGPACFKENLNASRPSEHPPDDWGGGGVSKRLGGIIGCKYKTSSWHLNGFPDGSNIVGSTI